MSWHAPWDWLWQSQLWTSLADSNSRFTRGQSKRGNRDTFHSCRGAVHWTHVPFFCSFLKTCRLSVWYSLFFLKWKDVFHTQPEKNSIFSISLSIPLLYDKLFAGNISQFSKTIVKHFQFWSEGFWRPFCQNRSDIDFDGLVVGIFQGLSNMFLHRIAMKFGFSLYCCALIIACMGKQCTLMINEQSKGTRKSIILCWQPYMQGFLWKWEKLLWWWWRFIPFSTIYKLLYLNSELETFDFQILVKAWG